MAKPLLLLLVLWPLACFALSTRLNPRHQRDEGGGDADRVVNVPGYHGDLPSDHYAGYISISATKNLFYYLVESEGNPAEDPVVLWLNGGPGCSSFDGFVYEMGPFKFEFAPSSSSGSNKGDSPALLLSDNPYAWNKAANMIYLDSPAGVGLSYSTKPSDYATGDMQTAADAQTFLRMFFERHPRFQSNKFFISGESYAGIYVPNLARAVAQGNAEGQQPHINLVGYLVGNGCTSEDVDGDAFPAFAAGKSLISKELYRSMEQACGGVYWNRSVATGPSAHECDRLYNEMTEALSALNLYDVLEDCYRGPNPDAAEEARRRYAEAARTLGSGPGGPRWPMVGAASKVGLQANWAQLGTNGVPPCTDSRLADAWLNNPAVRRAIHAAPAEAEEGGSGKEAVAGRWQLCSDRILYMREIQSTVPIHLALTQEHGLRALIYSGDHDLCVPHTGSERWTSELKLPLKREWGAWYEADYQVGGYWVEYKNLIYASVKGAGHMVPQNKPRQALAMFERFISDKGNLKGPHEGETVSSSFAAA